MERSSAQDQQVASSSSSSPSSPPRKNKGGRPLPKGSIPLRGVFHKPPAGKKRGRPCKSQSSSLAASGGEAPQSTQKAPSTARKGRHLSSRHQQQQHEEEEEEDDEDEEEEEQGRKKKKKKKKGKSGTLTAAGNERRIRTDTYQKKLAIREDLCYRHIGKEATLPDLPPLPELPQLHTFPLQYDLRHSKFAFSQFLKHMKTKWATLGRSRQQQKQQQRRRSKSRSKEVFDYDKLSEIEIIRLAYLEWGKLRPKHKERYYANLGLVRKKIAKRVVLKNKVAQVDDLDSHIYVQPAEERLIHRRRQELLQEGKEEAEEDDEKMKEKWGDGMIRDFEELMPDVPIGPPRTLTALLMKREHCSFKVASQRLKGMKPQEMQALKKEYEDMKQDHVKQLEEYCQRRASPSSLPSKSSIPKHPPSFALSSLPIRREKDPVLLDEVTHDQQMSSSSSQRRWQQQEEDEEEGEEEEQEEKMSHQRRGRGRPQAKATGAPEEASSLLMIPSQQKRARGRPSIWAGGGLREKAHHRHHAAGGGGIGEWKAIVTEEEEGGGGPSVVQKRGRGRPKKISSAPLLPSSSSIGKGKKGGQGQVDGDDDVSSPPLKPPKPLKETPTELMEI